MVLGEIEEERKYGDRETRRGGECQTKVNLPIEARIWPIITYQKPEKSVYLCALSKSRVIIHGGFQSKILSGLFHLVAAGSKHFRLDLAFAQLRHADGPSGWSPG